MSRLHRILITGSRDWPDYMAIAKTVLGYISERGEIDVDGTGLPVSNEWVIVHGACPTGADHWADQFAVAHWIEQEPHPARWKVDGVYHADAGLKRNAEMVNLGAEVCLAFICPCNNRQCPNRGRHGSHGASHTADLAEQAGIETRRLLYNARPRALYGRYV